MKGLKYLFGAGIFAFLLATGARFYDEIKHQITFNAEQYCDARINADERRQFTKLEEVLNSSAAISGNLDRFNPEFNLFALSDGAYALFNIASIDSSLNERAKTGIENAIQKVISPDVADYWKFRGFPITESQIDNADYLGRLNLMINRYHKLGGKKYADLSGQITQHLAERFRNSPQKSIQSYDGWIWTCDNALALESIYLYDELNRTNFSGEPIEEWKKWMKEHMTEEDTGLLFSAMNPATSEITQAPRATSLGLTVIHSSTFDDEFAKEQWELLKKYFMKKHPVVGFREWKKGTAQEEDADSGPIPFGCSVAGTGIAMGAAKAVGDNKTFTDIAELAEFLGIPSFEDSAKSYAWFSPLSDALLAEFQSLKPSDAKYKEDLKRRTQGTISLKYLRGESPSQRYNQLRNSVEYNSLFMVHNMNNQNRDSTFNELDLYNYSYTPFVNNFDADEREQIVRAPWNHIFNITQYDTLITEDGKIDLTPHKHGGAVISAVRTSKRDYVIRIRFDEKFKRKDYGFMTAATPATVDIIYKKKR